MRVLVCGGRDYDDAVRVGLVLDWLHELFVIETVIHGAAKGADTLAQVWAIENDVVDRPFEAEWDVHGKRAGVLRNTDMLYVGQPDVVIAFPGGRGTADMVAKAKRAKVPVGEIKDG